MEQSIIDDLKTLIYENKIETHVFEKLITILDSIRERFSDKAILQTRNEEGKIHTSRKTNYFIYREIGNKKTDAIFAGALERSPVSRKSPVIRVPSSNTYLEKVPKLFKCRFEEERKEEWTNVTVSQMTIDILKDLLNEAVSNYFNLKK